MRSIAIRWLVPLWLWSVGAGVARAGAQDHEVEVMRAAALQLRSTIPEGTRVTVNGNPQSSDAQTIRILLGGDPAPLTDAALAAVAEVLGADLRNRDTVVRREEQGGRFIALSLVDTDRFVTFFGPVIDGDEARVYMSHITAASRVEASGERRERTAQAARVMHLTRSPEGWRFDRYGFGVVE